MKSGALPPHQRTPVNLGGAQSPPIFRLLDCVVESTMEMRAEFVEDNIRRNRARNVRKMWELPDYGMWKGEEIAIVAGGPSLNDTYAGISAFNTIVACGTVHDHLLELGIRPSHAIMCDPDPVALNWLTRPIDGCKYFLASSVDPEMFDQLEPYEPILWHCYGGLNEAIFDAEPAVCGGCTVTLRAISLLIAMGYHRMHFFGFDSSFRSTDEHHAYDHNDSDTRIKVRVGGLEGREFLTTGGFMAQASQFQELVSKFGYMFDPVIHGDGLIAEIMKQREMMQ